MTLRTAVVGASIVSENNHLPAMRRNPRTELVAVCDVDEEAAKALERGEQPPVPLAHSHWVLTLLEQVRDAANRRTESAEGATPREDSGLRVREEGDGDEQEAADAERQ